MQANSQIIPIFYTISDVFSTYVRVSIRSLIDNCRQEYFYRIHVLHCGISPINIERLISMSTSSVVVECINIEEQIASIKEEHFRTELHKSPPEVFYRVLIPSLFPQYDKIIYLDCDLIICTDIANLFNIDLGGYLLAASYAHGFQAREIGDFNSGVMSINCKKWRDTNGLERFLTCLKERNKSNPNLASDDQTILVLAFQQEVLFLEYSWNYRLRNSELFYLNATENLDDQFEFPDVKIIHFAGPKPSYARNDQEFTKFLNSIKDYYFWKYAFTTEHNETTLGQHYIKSIFQDKKEHARIALQCKNLLIPQKEQTTRLLKGIFSGISQDLPFCLMGAGKEGAKLLRILQSTGGLQPLAICDNNPEVWRQKVLGIPIMSVDEAKEQFSDFYVFISSSKYYYEILGTLEHKVNDCRVFPKMEQYWDFL